MYGTGVRNVVMGTDIAAARPVCYMNPIIRIPGVCHDINSCLEIPEEDMKTGTIVLGKTGSGKTYLLKKMIKELRLNSDKPYSMIIVQAKNDYDELISDGDLVLEQGNKEGSVKWNFFEDLLADGYDMDRISLNVREFTRFLFSYKKDSKEPFFQEAAAELLYCIIITYIKSGMTNLHSRKKLTNRGLVQFFENYTYEDYIWIFENCGEPGVLNRLLGEESDNRQSLGIWGELITTVLRTFVDVFAEEGDFSIREFVKDKRGRALFINYDPAYKETQSVLYSTMINLALKEVLSRNESDGNVILVCDELSTIGKNDLAGAVNLGRAKGLITICGCQSIEQLHALFGEHDANAFMAGMCTRIYFSPNDYTTVKYMQSDFGMCLADYLTLSPGGCGSIRKEGHVLECKDINSMRRGDFYYKGAQGSMFSFRIF